MISIFPPLCSPSSRFCSASRDDLQQNRVSYSLRSLVPPFRAQLTSSESFKGPLDGSSWTTNHLSQSLTDPGHA
ncbi:hypothetical protein CFRS1_v004735 [Colletotrichum fructicola]|nr:hypothetical protein CFRS1_v004735 [Colletotrichum fructicola]